MCADNIGTAIVGGGCWHQLSDPPPCARALRSDLRAVAATIRIRVGCTAPSRLSQSFRALSLKFRLDRFNSPIYFCCSSAISTKEISTLRSGESTPGDRSSPVAGGHFDKQLYIVRYA